LDLAVLFTSMVAYFLARITILKLEANQKFKNLVTWAFISISGVFAPPLAFFALTGRNSSELWVLVPVGLVSYSFSVFSFGILISSLIISRVDMAYLKGEQARLTSTQADLVEQIRLIRESIRKDVEVELHKALQVLSENKPTPQSVSDRLFKAIDMVIRPLSHRLVEIDAKQTELPPTRIDLQTKPVGSLSSVELSRLSAPDVFLLPVLFTILPTAYYVNGIIGLVAALLLAGLNVSFLWLVERHGANIRINRVLGIALLGSFGGGIGLAFPLIFSTPDSLGVALGFAFTSYATAGLLALISRRLDVKSRLSYVNQEMQISVSVLRQESWALKAQLAKAIHGSVQTKFLSLALRLGRLKRISKSQLAAAAIEIQDSIASVEDSFRNESKTFDEQMELISSAWAESVTINLKISKKVRQLIDDHPLARTCVVEVIGEAVSNAAKHSSSPSVTVQISNADGDAIDVLVTSEGRLSSIDNSRKGYGSKMLNEVTAAWALTSNKGRVSLHAVVPLAK
jgi:anti-sigma regulatory factor (Ser/Thr protein kinase)